MLGQEDPVWALLLRFSPSLPASTHQCISPRSGLVPGAQVVISAGCVAGSIRRLMNGGAFWTDEHDNGQEAFCCFLCLWTSFSLGASESAPTLGPAESALTLGPATESGVREHRVEGEPEMYTGRQAESKALCT